MPGKHLVEILQHINHDRVGGEIYGVHVGRLRAEGVGGRVLRFPVATRPCDSPSTGEGDHVKARARPGRHHVVDLRNTSIRVPFTRRTERENAAT